MDMNFEGTPLRMDEGGAVRVGNCRVLLAIVIYEFQQYSSPEEIVSKYPTLDLGDVYLVIGYYLHNREAVDRFLAERERQAEENRKKWEAIYPPQTGIRERLLARKAAQQAAAELASQEEPLPAQRKS